MTVTQKGESNGLDAVKEDLSALRTDLDKLVQTLGNDATKMGKEAWAESRKQVKNLANAAEGQIEQNPFTTMAAAFGLGLIIGRLMSK